MKKEVKAETINFGKLKEIKIQMPQKWLSDLWRRYKDKKIVKIDIKDLVNKIYENSTKK